MDDKEAPESLPQVTNNYSARRCRQWLQDALIEFFDALGRMAARRPVTLILIGVVFVLICGSGLSTLETVTKWNPY